MESDKARDFGYIDGVAQEERVTELSDEQGMAIASVKGFMDGNGFGHYVIGGVAGSGKSTVIPYIVDECGTPYSAGTGQGSVAVCAYTGKAVMNLKRKGIPNAMTLHSFLYDTRVSTDSMTGEKIVVHSRKDDWCFRGIRLLIVDEASMVSREMFDIIESLPFKTVYIGDHFQLPPVNDRFNIMEKPDFRMERIHRQELDNPIVALADMARNGKPIPLGVFGASKHTRSLDRSDLPAYSEIVTWTNATKDAVNECIRESRGFQKDVPQVDDKMIVRVNNRSKNVYNGQIVYLVSNPVLMKTGAWKVEFVDELAYDDPFMMALTDGATVALASVHLPKNRLDEIRSMPFTNLKQWRTAKRRNPYEVHLDWGYAITCHSAQGTSWRNVAVITDGRMRRVMDKEEYSRWLYTAITRAEESVTIYSGGFNG